MLQRGAPSLKEGVKVMNKAQRHVLIRDLIANNDIDTQEELVTLLEEKGNSVTQATVSRDIKELHLVKVPSLRGGYRYSLPADNRFNPLDKLKRTLVDSFIRMVKVNNTLIMHTLPGNANAIASLIDNSQFKGIAGTISGDDTILVICLSEQSADEYETMFLEML